MNLIKNKLLKLSILWLVLFGINTANANVFQDFFSGIYKFFGKSNSAISANSISFVKPVAQLNLPRIGGLDPKTLNGRKIMLDLDQFDRHQKKVAAVCFGLCGLFLTALGVIALKEVFWDGPKFSLSKDDKNSIFKFWALSGAFKNKDKNAAAEEVKNKFFNKITDENVNDEYSLGFSPIHYACKYDNLSLLKWLVDDFGADIYTTTSGENGNGGSYGGSINRKDLPIEISLKNKSPETFKYLAEKYLSSPNDSEKNKIETLEQHISYIEVNESGFKDVFKEIIENYCKNKERNEKLYFLNKIIKFNIVRSCPELVRYILDYVKNDKMYLTLSFHDPSLRFYRKEYARNIELANIAIENIFDAIKGGLVNSSNPDLHEQISKLAIFVENFSRPDLFEDFLMRVKKTSLDFTEITKAAVKEICRNNNLDLIKILLKHNLSLDIYELARLAREGLTCEPIIKRAINDAAKVKQYLVENFNLNEEFTKNNEKIDAIVALSFFEVKYGKFNIVTVRKILDKIRGEDSEDQYLQTLMDASFKYLNFEIIKYLFEESEVVKIKKIRPTAEVFNFIYDNHTSRLTADYDDDLYKYIVIANNRLDEEIYRIVKFLIESGIYKVNDVVSARLDHQHIIDIAIKTLNSTLIKYLIENGAEINNQKLGYFCGMIYSAASFASPEDAKKLKQLGLNIAKYFIDNGVEINADTNYYFRAISKFLKEQVSVEKGKFVTIVIDFKEKLEDLKRGFLSQNKEEIFRDLHNIKNLFNNKLIPNSDKQAFLNDIIKYYYCKNTNDIINEKVLIELFGEIEFNYYFIHGRNDIRHDQQVAHQENENAEPVNIKNRHKEAIKFAISKGDLIKDKKGKSIIDAIVCHDDQGIYIPFVIEEMIHGNNSLDNLNGFIKNATEKIGKNVAKKSIVRGLKNARTVARYLGISKNPIKTKNDCGRKLSMGGGLCVENGEIDSEGIKCKEVKDLGLDTVAEIMGYVGIDFGPKVLKN